MTERKHRGEIYLRGETYHCYFRDYKTGKRIRASLKTSNQNVARENLRILKEQVASGSFFSNEETKTEALKTVGDFAADYVSEVVFTWENASNRKWFERELKKRIVPKLGADKALAHVTKADLIALRSDLYRMGRRGKTPRENSNARINRAFSYTRLFFEAALEREHISINPAASIKKLKESGIKSRTLLDDDIVKVFEETGQPAADMFLAAVTSGLRLGVVQRLTDKNVVQDDGVHYFSLHTLKTKTNRYQLIPIHPTVLPSILDRAARRGLLFPPPKGGKVYSPRRRFTRAIRTLGLQGVTFHGLRRTFITILAEQGTATHLIQKLVGHARISQTEDYIDKERLAKQAALQAMKGLDRTMSRLTLIKKDPRTEAQSNAILCINSVHTADTN